MFQVSHFRLYPSKTVEKKLFSSFDCCCFVYNYCLENQIFKDNVLPSLKQQHLELKGVHNTMLQNVVHQLSDNLHGLATLKRKGKKAAKLRLKNCFEIWVFFGKTELNDAGSWGSFIRVKSGMAETLNWGW